MAKRKRENTPDIIDRRIKEGRGAGRGGDYKPWLLVQDVPSQGLASRVKGVKTGRVHHLLSQLEHRCFLILDWSEQVTDIREQYPLLPLKETFALAESLGINIHGILKPKILSCLHRTFLLRSNTGVHSANKFSASSLLTI